MGLQSNFKNETVDRLEMRKAISVPRTDKIDTVVRSMRENEIGCVVVVDDDKKPIGFFTESMVVEMLCHGGLHGDDMVGNQMSTQFPWVRITDPIADVVEAMEIKNTRILCVVDNDDNVLGITGQRGVMEYVAEHFPGQVMVQRVGLAPNLCDREGA